MSQKLKAIKKRSRIAHRLKRICFMTWNSAGTLTPVEWKCKVVVEWVLDNKAIDGMVWKPKADIELEWLLCQKHYRLFDSQMVGALYALPYKGAEGRIVWVEQIETASDARSKLIGDMEKESRFAFMKGVHADENASP